MVRPTVCVGIAGLTASLVLFGSVRPAFALKPFKDEFEATYVKPDSKDPKDVAFAVAVKEAKCTICHGKTKAERNVYGRQLDKLLSEEDAEKQARIREAILKVAAMKVDPAKPDSPTFGDRIRQGRLPACE